MTLDRSGKELWPHLIYHNEPESSTRSGVPPKQEPCIILLSPFLYSNIYLVLTHARLSVLAFNGLDVQTDHYSPVF